MNQRLALFLLGASALLAGACTNGGLPSNFKSKLTTSAFPSGVPSSVSTYFAITDTLAVQPTPAATDRPPSLTVSFNPASSSGSIRDVCGTEGQCNCDFEWNEVNNTNGTAVTIKRKAQTAAIASESYRLRCMAPNAWVNEIDSGTTLNLTITGIGRKLNAFVTNIYSFPRQASSGGQGSFSDYQGRPFETVMRYSCFENFRRGTRIASRKAVVSGDGGTVRMAFANQFCFKKLSGDSLVDTCSEDFNQLKDDPAMSSQAYSYNLYIRRADRGDIQYEGPNEGYICPKVAPDRNAPEGTVTDSQYYPLDSTFALALSPSEDYPIGIDAPSKLSGGQSDGSNSGSTCQALLDKSGTSGLTAGSGGADSAFQVNCLGFAAQPKKDGSCPLLKNYGGSEMPTYRLRRYFAAYPTQFNTNGAMINDRSPRVDVIYVLDRPVSARNRAGDGFSEYTIRGPKPCPFSLLDYNGVTDDNYRDRIPRAQYLKYLATNDPAWENLNVDGIALPHIDHRDPATNDASTQSCSAAIPVFKHLIDPQNGNRETSVWSIATVNRNSPAPELQSVQIRPIKPWTPNYQEDTGFQACAPMPPDKQFIDPPLHVAKLDNSNNYAWCALTLPTLHPVVDQLRSLAGTPGTSSTKDPNNSAQVERPIIPKDSDGVNKPLKRYNLVAPHEGILRALKEDPSYQCNYTFDERRGKTGVASPQSGCCSDPSFTDRHIENNRVTRVPATEAGAPPSLDFTACKKPMDDFR